MQKGLTELVFILDRSGSMSGLESDTIGGFNGMLNKQKKEEGDANVTTVLFDDQIEIIHDRFPIKAVKPMTDADYYVRGCTALLDAVASSFCVMPRSALASTSLQVMVSVPVTVFMSISISVFIYAYLQNQNNSGLSCYDNPIRSSVQKTGLTKDDKKSSSTS